MMHAFIERELKFDVDPNFALPTFTKLLPHGARIEQGSEQQRSDYFDTAEHDLLAAGLTLRRRFGTADVGWQLKVPLPSFREEIRASSSDSDVPEELSDLIKGVTRGRPLRQIASIATQRSLTRLVDLQGVQLAEIADDSVHASAGGRVATASRWREIEVELGNNDLDLLHALDKRLQRRGARPSTSSSKLARALPEDARTTPAPRRATVGAAKIIGAYLTEQKQALLAGDVALRRGHDDAVHKTRVATRRLRSTLRVFEPLLDRERAAALDSELRRYAALLGQVRDRQVLRRRLNKLLDETDSSLLLGPVRARIDTELQTEQHEHWDVLQEELNSDRYLRLLAEIESWVWDVPMAVKPTTSARRLRELTQKAERKVVKRLRRANASGDTTELHRARKAAKRARYAAETAEPVLGRKAAPRHTKRYQNLQDLLGEHQDSLVSAALLRRLGAKAGTIYGENGFAFGVVYEREQHNALRARAKAKSYAEHA